MAISFRHHFRFFSCKNDFLNSDLKIAVSRNYYIIGPKNYNIFYAKKKFAISFRHHFSFFSCKNDFLNSDPKIAVSHN